MNRLALFIVCVSAVVFGSCKTRQVPVPFVEEPLPAEAVEEATEDDADIVPADLEFPLPESDLPVSSFREIWAYLIDGREQTLKAGYPLTDVGYFGAELDSYGKLINVPNPKKVSFYRGRLHLVVASSGRALTHFALARGSREREELIRDLLKATEAFDGLQIDFEYVPPMDGGAFLSFLEELSAELRSGPGGKMFTIALPARTRTLQEDVYEYRTILPLVDRILVMAYDEHWSTSAPGPIASMNWCGRVASYSLETIGNEKLIMGLPFYGRSWGDINPNRAFMFSGIEGIKKAQQISETERENGVPFFTYQTPLEIKVYYEDDYSLSARLEMYRRMGVNSVGFWCLGQETPAIWPLLRLE
jgi:spore germination protein YaaH